MHSGVNTGILNDKKQSPVHLATELNKVKALKVMGNYREIIDIQKGGEHGRTALHLAAIYGMSVFCAYANQINLIQLFDNSI